MKKIILICTYLFIIKFSLSAAHQATNILATIYPTNQIVGTFTDFRYYLRINDVTNAKVDTFIIYNPYTNYHINNVSSVTVDSTAQWLMESSTRPAAVGFFSWYYDDGKLILLSSQSAVTSGHTVIIHFQQNLPTITGTNFQYHAKYSNSQHADGTNSCTEFSNGWKVDILPGDLDKFQMKNCPTICTAGFKWSNTTFLTVIAYDMYDNIKTDFTNSIYFKTTSPLHWLKYSNNITSFTCTNNGISIINRSNFMLNSAGNQYLIVTNETFLVSKKSDAIEVITGEVDGFISSVSVETGIAGDIFYIKVESATDECGNNLTGTAVVEVTNSDIIDYTLNNISVNNGIGSNTQIIRDATTNKVVFKIKMGSYSNYVSISNILPAEDVGSLEIISSVSVVTAGRFINQPVYVKVYDIYDNLKYNSTNRVYFTNTAGDGIFTNDSGNAYKFTNTDKGEHRFSWTNFTFTKAGTRDLIVTNEKYKVSDKLTGITVVAGEIKGFISSVSVETGIAGDIFYIKVESATDECGNNLTGTAVVEVTNSDIIDYTLNNISVNNGIGSNTQIIRDAATNKVVFKIKMGSYSNYVSISNILPAEDVGSLEIISSVSVVTAGRFINQPVYVKVYDIYDNLKYNSTNRVYFTNAAGDGIFTNDSGNAYKFTNTDKGEHRFSWTNFVFTKAGSKDLIVTNEKYNVSDKLTGITVIAGEIKGFISSVSVETGIAGDIFYIKVESVTDECGNNLTGTAVVEVTNSDIIDYTLNNISVNNGIGSNTQIIRDAATNKVVFKIKMGSYSNYVSISNILPAEDVGSLEIISSVSVVTAGRFINQPVYVKVYDIYDNLKYNSTNRVYFTNAAGDGIFTNDSGNAYKFTNTDKGEHRFSWTNFTFTKAGTRDLIVTNEKYNVSDKLTGITVVAGEVDGFILNTSVKTAKAGTPFYIEVTGATDSYGNFISGDATVEITNSTGIQAPDGSIPSVNDIVVVGGSGSSLQTLVNATINDIVFMVILGDKTNYHSITNTYPGDLNSLGIISSVSKVTAGQHINENVTVSLYDNYLNIATRSTNKIYFLSSDTSAIFTNDINNPYIFKTNDNGVKEFPNTNFTYNTIGIQDLIVTNTNMKLSAIKEGIEVVSSEEVSGFFLTGVTECTAGIAFSLNITGATDSYGNKISGMASVSITNPLLEQQAPNWNMPILNNILVTLGDGSANQILVRSTTNNIVLKVGLGKITNYHTISNTYHGGLNSLGIISSVSKVTVGKYINEKVTVELYDNYLNIATSSTESIYFKSSDTSAIFTNDVNYPYTFKTNDKGIREFPNTNFTYMTVGVHNLIVTNTNLMISAYKEGIQVISGGLISGFSLSGVTEATCGKAFMLNITGATDIFGYPISGITATVEITNDILIQRAPDNSLPSINDIVVLNGDGNSLQILVNATTNDIVFRVGLGGITNSFTVSNTYAGDLNSLGIASTVSKVTAGQHINENVTVSLYDNYLNIATRSTNKIYFLSSDTSAIFTNDINNPYIFKTNDNGVKEFPNTNFTYNTIGIQDLIVTNTNYNISAIKEGIEVVAGEIKGFISSVSVETGIAGDIFYIKVESATDECGNNLTGTAVVEVTNSDIIDYTLNNISVNNGIGSNTQIIRDAATNKVVFKIKMGSYSNYVSISNILPAEDVGSLEIISSVSVVTAGRFINQPVYVKVYDIYDNLKYNSTNRVYFTNAAGDGIFTNNKGNAYKFTNTDKGEHKFSWTNFTFTKAGSKDLIVTNEKYNVSDKLTGITVVAGEIKGFISSVSVETGIAGDIFYIKVESATDECGNNLTGTAVVDVTNSDIIDYTLNNITVNNGIGSNTQIIRDAATNKVVFKIKMGSYSNYVSISNILPAEDVGSLEIISSVSVVTAGRFINQPVYVKVYDIYDNLKYDSTNSVYFKSKDNRAIFTNNSTHPYQFTNTDSGAHSFSGIDFIFKTSGLQDLAVTNVKYKKSDRIYLTVISDLVKYFDVYVDNNIPKAGEKFYVHVTNAIDSCSNKIASSTMKVTNIVGGGDSPGGDSPIFNNIIINNGEGSAYQTLFNATNTILKITDLNSGVTNVTGFIKVIPDFAAGTITLVPNPYQTNADGVSVSLITSSIITDQYQNIMTNGKFATVNTTLGEITNSGSPSAQIPIKGGTVEFGLKSDKPGKATVTMSVDSIFGMTNVLFKGITLESVSSTMDPVSIGQNNIPINFEIRNTSSSTLKNASIGLILSPASPGMFLGIGPTNNIAILPNTTMTMQFLVTVNNATNGTYILDGYVTNGQLNGENVNYTGASTKGLLTVQNPGQLFARFVNVPGQVVVDYNFAIEVSVKNIGEATMTNVNLTNFQISLTNAVYFFNPTNYSPKNLTLLAGESNSFLFNFTASGNTTDMYFYARPMGIEKNTGIKKSYPIAYSGTIDVTTLAEVKLRLTKENLSPITVFKGQQDVVMLKMSLYNPLGSGAVNIVEVRQIRFDAQDYTGTALNPTTAINKIRIYDDSQTYLETSNIPQNNPLNLNFTQVMNVNPSTTKDFFISIDISPGASAETFALNVGDSSYIKANIINFTNSIIEEVVDTQGNDIYNLRSDFVVIKGNTFDDVKGNYPNPFKAGSECTTIEYYLKTEGTVTIKIYTLTGYLVRTLIENERRYAGIQKEEWCGENNSSSVVRNGIYLAVIKAQCQDQTYEGVIKIAVVK